jgi:xylan 1,4-beta-xylosidase
MAGLVCYYNTTHFYYLYLTGGEIDTDDKLKYLNILCCDNNHMLFPMPEPINISNAITVYLKAKLNGARLQFYYATNKEKEQPQWHKIGPVLDSSILSDDYVQHPENGYSPCFTGAFFGLACQDLSGQKCFADFAYFNYQEIN